MPDPPPAYSGADLRRFRRERGWTLVEMSVWAGFHHGNLSRYERGLSAVPVALRRILHLSGARRGSGR